jgi:cation transport ATPase
VDTVLLDKTGTLTFGTPQIREILSADGFGEHQIIEAASIAERKSEHPLAKEVVVRATELAIPPVEPDEFSYTPGRGIRVSYRGEEILVGSLALLVEHGMTGVCLSLVMVRAGHRKSTSLAQGNFLGASETEPSSVLCFGIWGGTEEIPHWVGVYPP